MSISKRTRAFLAKRKRLKKRLAEDKDQQRHILAIKRIEEYLLVGVVRRRGVIEQSLITKHELENGFYPAEMIAKYDLTYLRLYRLFSLILNQGYYYANEDTQRIYFKPLDHHDYGVISNLCVQVTYDEETNNFVSDGPFMTSMDSFVFGKPVLVKHGSRQKTNEALLAADVKFKQQPGDLYARGMGLHCYISLYYGNDIEFTEHMRYFINRLKEGKIPDPTFMMSLVFGYSVRDRICAPNAYTKTDPKTFE